MPQNTSWEADIIVLAVPYAAEKEIATKIKEVANQKVVIGIANPLNESYSGLLLYPKPVLPKNYSECCLTQKW